MNLRNNWRWVICGLLLLANTTNYVDRSVIGILKPTISKDLHWKESDFAAIIAWFQFFYAIGYAISGRFLDKVGMRVGFTFAVGLWSLAACATAFVNTVFSFTVVRSVLGFAEGANFPAISKTAGEWFPTNERATAVGVALSGVNVGAIFVPLIVPWITLHYGWPAAFWVTGSLGGIWLIGWLALYFDPQKHPYISEQEKAYIGQNEPAPETKISWLELLRYPATWSMIFLLGFAAPVWFFYTNWIPDLLGKQYHVDLKSVGLPLVIVYIIGDLGALGGGAIHGWLMRAGWTSHRARIAILAVCTLSVIPIAFVPWMGNMTIAIVAVSMAMAAHQAWCSNIYPIPSEYMPRSTVASIVGLGGFVGSMIGVGFSILVGYILDHTHSYALILPLCPLAYIIAFVGGELALRRANLNLTKVQA